MDALRLRLEEKEATLNKKSKQIQEMSEEKGTLNGEIHDLKDMLEVKERKVNVLQKKVRPTHLEQGSCQRSSSAFVARTNHDTASINTQCSALCLSDSGCVCFACR